VKVQRSGTICWPSCIPGSIFTSMCFFSVTFRAPDLHQKHTQVRKRERARGIAVALGTAGARSISFAATRAADTEGRNHCSAAGVRRSHMTLALRTPMTKRGYGKRERVMQVIGLQRDWRKHTHRKRMRDTWQREHLSTSVGVFAPVPLIISETKTDADAVILTERHKMSVLGRRSTRRNE
jgi:hypothetical protein